jgi:hypothetical protein
MTFIFLFYGSVVKFIQVLLQFLDFVLNRKTRSGIFVDLSQDLCAHRREIAESRLPCGHGPSKIARLTTSSYNQPGGCDSASSGRRNEPHAAENKNGPSA